LPILVPETCRDIFRSLQIFTLYSQYIYSLLLFIIKNKHLFTTNNEIHDYNTRNINNLHPNIINLTKFKKGPYTMYIKVFNHLPQSLKDSIQNPTNHLPQSLKDSIQNPTQFKYLLKRFLYQHSFYSMQEYFDFNVHML